MKEENRDHWQRVYEEKDPREVSWTQERPGTSLDFIHGFQLDKSAKIIDIGGGDSRLVDFLLDEGYENITVLDISSKALEKAKLRLGEKAHRVNWIAEDIVDFKPEPVFDLWHDRATFHFLTTEAQIRKYLRKITESVKAGGYAIMGTFSINGPERCSGLPVKQYSAESLSNQLSSGFERIKCITEDHTTPFQTKQNFLFCSFQRTVVSQAE